MKTIANFKIDPKILKNYKLWCDKHQISFSLMCRIALENLYESDPESIKIWINHYKNY